MPDAVNSEGGGPQPPDHETKQNAPQGSEAARVDSPTGRIDRDESSDEGGRQRAIDAAQDAVDTDRASDDTLDRRRAPEFDDDDEPPTGPIPRILPIPPSRFDDLDDDYLPGGPLRQGGRIPTPDSPDQRFPIDDDDYEPRLDDRGGEIRMDRPDVQLSRKGRLVARLVKMRYRGRPEYLEDNEAAAILTPEEQAVRHQRIAELDARVAAGETSPVLDKIEKPQGSIVSKFLSGLGFGRGNSNEGADLPPHPNNQQPEAGDSSPDAPEVRVDDGEGGEYVVGSVSRYVKEKLGKTPDSKTLRDRIEISKILLSNYLSDENNKIVHAALGTPTKRTVVGGTLVALAGSYLAYRGYIAIDALTGGALPDAPAIGITETVSGQGYAEGQSPASLGGGETTAGETPTTTDAASTTTEAPRPSDTSTETTSSPTETTTGTETPPPISYNQESNSYTIPGNIEATNFAVPISPTDNPETIQSHVDSAVNFYLEQSGRADDAISAAESDSLRQGIIDDLQQTVQSSTDISDTARTDLLQALQDAENYNPPTDGATTSETTTTAAPTTTTEAPATTTSEATTAPTTTMESTAPGTTDGSTPPDTGNENPRTPEAGTPGTETPGQGPEAQTVPPTPDELRAQLETSFSELQHTVEPGEGYWKIIQGYVDQADPTTWTNAENGVTKGDVIADMLTTFANENGVRLPMLHPGDTLSPELLADLNLTPDQIQVLTEAMGTDSAGAYIENVMPRFEQVQEGQPLAALEAPADSANPQETTEPAAQAEPAEPIVAPAELPQELQESWVNFDHAAVDGDTRSEVYRDYFRDHSGDLPNGYWSDEANNTSKATELANLWTDLQERHGLEPSDLSIGEHVNFADWDKFTPAEQQVFLETMNTDSFQDYINNVLPDYEALNNTTDTTAATGAEANPDAAAEQTPPQPQTELQDVPQLNELFNENFTITHPGGPLSDTLQQQLAQIDTFRNWPQQDGLNNLSAVLTDMLVDNSAAHGFNVDSVPAGTYSLADLNINPGELQDLMLRAVEQGSATEYINNVQQDYINAKDGWK